jgi:hypothetical protein
MAQGTGKVAVPGCNLGLTSQNACAVWPPVISN